MEVVNRLKDAFSNSSTRILTGIALLFVVGLVGIFNSPFIIWSFLGIITYFALDESMKLFKIEHKGMFVHFIVIWFLAYLMPSVAHNIVFLYAVLFASILAYKKELNLKLFLPLAYPIAPMLFILALYIQFGIISLLWLLVIVALCDIGAYFVGKSMGKTQFCKTSPKKTLEGVIGGIFLATFFGTIIGIFAFDFKYSIIIISFVTAVASIFGDLFESYLKREAGVKDSGDILPGHGGALDRVDGYLFAAIVMYILMNGLIV
jgi:phosphatidate cytidylyltransferase